MIENGMVVKMANEDMKEHFAFMESLFGKTGNFDGFGEVVEVAPKDLRIYPLFEGLHEEQATSGLDNALVYYDKGAERHFVVEANEMEVIR